jgi:hypothetical protein
MEQEMGGVGKEPTGNGASKNNSVENVLEEQVEVWMFGEDKGKPYIQYHISLNRQLYE